ncbi:hypothetical protein [Nonomuraea sp. SBT364]|uniref:hypothetical protein n=1 Tax=Nonomuraea sp. SBT364 TaxID=1580530 RepID=UPI0012E19E8D|nr:hypothetical protein [Nonomuraea sp. SBT364]
MDHPWQTRTQCLIEAGPADTVDVRVRFLQVVTREVARARGDELELAPELTVDGVRYLAGQESREREVAVSGVALGELMTAPSVMEVDVPADQEAVWLIDVSGRAGAVLRGWEALHGRVEVRAELLREGLFQLTVLVANTTECGRHAFVSVLAGRAGERHALLSAPIVLEERAPAAR